MTHIKPNPMCDECIECEDGDATPAIFAVKSGAVEFFFDLDGDLVGKTTSVSYLPPIRYLCENCAKNSDGDYVFIRTWPKRIEDVNW